MGIAGLWSAWQDPAGGLTCSYTMLTINADDHPGMRQYHTPDDEKRMVVILEEADYDAWLRASVADGRAFLRQFDAGNLRPSRPNVRSCEADGRLSPFSVDKPVGRGLARPVTC